MTVLAMKKNGLTGQIDQRSQGLLSKGSAVIMLGSAVSITRGTYLLCVINRSVR